MIRNYRFAIAGVALCILVYGPMYFFFKKNAEKCDQVIFLEGETSRDCRDVMYMSDGNIAYITYCDGTREEVPIGRIIKVIEKEDVR